MLLAGAYYFYHYETISSVFKFSILARSVCPAVRQSFILFGLPPAGYRIKCSYLLKLFTTTQKQKQHSCRPSAGQGLWTYGDHVLQNDYGFQVLIVMVMSRNTRDESLQKAVDDLRENNMFSLTDIISREEEEAIRQIAKILQMNAILYHNKKAEYVVEIARKIHLEYNGTIPRDISVDYIKSLPGVGPKIAFVFLWAVFQRIEGIPFDSHLVAIIVGFKFAKSKTKDPEAGLRAEVEERIKKDLGSNL
jgi:endonuclease III